MIDLYFGYFLILIIFLAINIPLFLEIKSTKKFLLISILFSIVLFIIISISTNFKSQLIFLNDYYCWIFIILAIFLFIDSYFYLKNKKYYLNCFIFIFIFVISSQLNSITLFDNLIVALLFLIILFGVFNISKLLHYTKRGYNVVVNEFLVLESIFLFICGLTYYACLNIDFTSFSSFLILTPIYQLFYVLIAIGFLLIIGLLINEYK